MSPDPPDDLLARWQDHGDAEALDLLLQREIELLRLRIRRDGSRLLSASVSAGDIAQEVAVRLLEHRNEVSFESPASLRAYLWQAAWRLLIDRLRRRGRKIVSPDVTPMIDARAEETSSISAVEREEQKSALLLAMNLLEPGEQDILDMSYFQGCSIDAVAAKLGISPDAANMRLVRARRSLAKKLARWADLIG